MPAARQHKQPVGLPAGIHLTFPMKSNTATADSQVVVLMTHVLAVKMNSAAHKLIMMVTCAHAK